jgi:chemotaxis-related protein WspD
VADLPISLDRAAVDDCWNRIGVRGDRSCVELARHIHCHNCPVYTAAATELLNTTLPPGYLDEWTAHVASATVPGVIETRSVVLFRVGEEWLALPTAVVVEVASLRPIHSLPHRQSPIVLGLANVRGELLVCVSLGRLLQIDPPAPTRDGKTSAQRRLLVVRHEDARVICPVEAVHGTHRFHPGTLKELPATVAKAAATYSTGVIEWESHTVGVLDEQLLFYRLRRSLG